jgi:hypothetical protein
MRLRVLLIGTVVFTAACSTRNVIGLPAPRPDVVTTGDNVRAAGGPGRSPGKVPPGHFPKAGECRIWYANRPPGHQPPAARCSSLVGRVPAGAFLLYNSKAWDTEVDWRRQERSRPGSVPDPVLRIMTSLVR